MCLIWVFTLSTCEWQSTSSKWVKVVFSFQAVNWVELFLSLGGKCIGYEKAQITPYIHAMVYHVPKFMRIHNGIKKFTGQGKDGTIKSVFTNTK